MKSKIYKPPNYLYYIFVSIFCLVLFLIIMIKEVSFTTIVLFCFEILIIGALIELLKSNMAVNDSDIVINNLFKTKITKISDIESIKIEDHELYIFIKNNKRLDIPFWFPNKKSLYMVLKSRLNALRQ